MTRLAEMPLPGAPLPTDARDFHQLPPALQATSTRIVYVGVASSAGNRAWWDLAGPSAGRQGVSLDTDVSGLFHAPFSTKLTEGPWLEGSVYERSDVLKREINFAVSVGVPSVERPTADTPTRYRMVEERWWASWSKSEDGYLGVFTRTHGWRWLKVRLAEAPKGQINLDPVAWGNNLNTWAMTAVALNPYWHKRAAVNTWENPEETSTPLELVEELIGDLLIPGVSVGEGHPPAPNYGDVPTYPLLVVSGPGRVWIQDGVVDRMVELPMIWPDDGYVVVDTDPGQRTLTASKDPVDNLFFQIARNAQLLDVILHDLLSSTVPIWRRLPASRKPVFFTSPIPPRSPDTRLRVRHSHAGGTVTVIMRQRYDKPYG